MKSLAPLDPLDRLLDDYAIENLDWPEGDELDDFLIQCGTALDISAIGPPSGSACGTLFPDAVQERSLAGAPNRATTAWGELVRDAYLEVCGDNSIDRVIADPQLSARFVEACWVRDARVSQFDVTRALLNARKNKLIGPVQGVRPFHVQRERLDCYLFASEIALRLIQDREYYQSQRSVSLDRILCDPMLGQDFDELARSIAPGYSSFEYRWAAITIRKAQNRRAEVLREVPDFEVVGSASNIRIRQIATCAGFYWLRKGDNDLYIGHAQNLRSQIERILQAQLARLPAITELLLIEPRGSFQFAIAACSDLRSASNREPLKADLIRNVAPRLNVLKMAGRVA